MRPLHLFIVLALLLHLSGLLESQSVAAVLRYHWPEYQQAGEQAYLMENYPQAKKMFTKARIELEHWGQRNADLAETLNSLGIVSIVLGEFQSAEAYLKRALPMRERYLGPTHQGVAITLYNLGELYRLQGRNPESEAYFQKAEQIDPSITDSGVVNISFTPLGTLDSNGYTGQYVAPKLRNMPNPTRFGTPYLSTSLNTDVSAFLNDRGLSNLNRGMYQNAEYNLYVALHMNERVYGPSHPIIADSLNNLAIMYEGQGRFSEAEPLYLEALAIQEATLGMSHPDVIKTFKNLKQMYLIEGRFEDAEKLTQRYFPTPKETMNQKFINETFGVNTAPIPRDPNAKAPATKKAVKKKASKTTKKRASRKSSAPAIAGS